MSEPNARPVMCDSASCSGKSASVSVGDSKRKRERERASERERERSEREKRSDSKRQRERECVCVLHCTVLCALVCQLEPSCLSPLDSSFTHLANRQGLMRVEWHPPAHGCVCAHVSKFVRKKAEILLLL